MMIAMAERVIEAVVKLLSELIHLSISDISFSNSVSVGEMFSFI